MNQIIVPKFKPITKLADGTEARSTYGRNWGYYPKKAKAVKNIWFFKSKDQFGFILERPKNIFAKLKGANNAAPMEEIQYDVEGRVINPEEIKANLEGMLSGAPEQGFTIDMYNEIMNSAEDYKVAEEFTNPVKIAFNELEVARNAARELKSGRSMGRALRAELVKRAEDGKVQFKKLKDGVQNLEAAINAKKRGKRRTPESNA
jgi:hypothetical protein